MKAFDSVDWEFILQCITCFGVPSKFVKWIKECITTSRFSVSFNGTLVGYFEGKRGLRKGDLLSPYLFVLAMEVLLGLMEEAAVVNQSFIFHPSCLKLQLTHLCFTDDLLIFSFANLKTMATIKYVRHEFAIMSGLTANANKSAVYYNGVPQVLKQQILDCLQVKEGSL